MRVVVLGAGNILLGDEGLGVRAIERLPLAYCLPACGLLSPGVHRADRRWHLWYGNA